MWIVSGPFDGQVSGEISFEKSKLLKTGTKYVLGRKEGCRLVVNHKKVSKSNGEFIVGNYSREDVLDPSVVPRLELCNTKDKTLPISRGTDTISINPSATRELKDGDIVTVAGGVAVTVRWVRVCCFFPTVNGKATAPISDCALLGVSVTLTSHPKNTHHLLSTFCLNAQIATSLLSAVQFVKPEWLDELIRLGSLPAESGASPERSFALPPVNKFRPSVSATLPHTLKSTKIWEPSEERFKLFQDFTFLFVGENGREVEVGISDLVLRGHGECETFAAEGGRVKWRQALSRVKASKSQMGMKKLVTVADLPSMKTAVGPSAWAELMQESRSFRLQFISPEKILLAVVHADVSYIDCTVQAADNDEPSPLPAVVLNTYDDEPSVPPDEPSIPPSSVDAGPNRPSSRLTRRAPPAIASRTPSVPPEDLLGIFIPPPPRKPLVRRVKDGKPLIIGIDDPSSVLDAEPAASPIDEPSTSALEPPKISSFDLNAPIPTRSSRLKRRAGTTVSSPSSSQAVPSVLSNRMQPVDQPPLKKFKALFDSSDPANMTQEDAGSGLGDIPMSGTTAGRKIEHLAQSQMQSNRPIVAEQSAARGSGVLETVAEEEEQGSGENASAAKRKAGNLDIEMEVDESESAPPTVMKKRVVETVKTTGTLTKRMDPTGSKSHKPGAAPGNPDTDAAFLKALASTKRGKKTEDNFDREFNQLKISKPDLQAEKEDEWAILRDFGEDQNLRGNFMVVVEMDISCNSSGARARANFTSIDWLSRPNYKKFKKKATERTGQIVELVARRENDYGVGSAYWKGSRSQSQAQHQNILVHSQSQQQKPAKAETRPQKPPKITKQATELGSDEELVDQSLPPRTLASVTSNQPRRTRASPAPARAKTTHPLFLDDSGDEKSKVKSPNHDPGEHEDNDDATLRSSNSAKTQLTRPTGTVSKTKGRSARFIANDDSDDEGATFKGFRGRTRSGSRH